MGRRSKQESDRSSKDSILLKINIYNRQKALSISKKSVQRSVEALCTYLGIECEEISIYFVTEKKICDLHQKFFNDPSLTDCITFPVDAFYTRSDSQVGLGAGSKRRKSILEQGASIEEYNPLFKNRFSAGFNPAPRPTCESLRVYLGDIFVCPAAAVRFDPERAYQETLLYCIHGILHLLGYDDRDPKKRRIMRKMEKRCMDHLYPK
ncbi:MAG TPA: rRNA maturation RNase YbeY [Chlamydiales bacterium]|nr:rRNA maturation RNase YbeY [Chlamydiales bacterium]